VSRLRALIVKESYQVMRDPAALLIAFVLPPILLFLFAFAMSLDVEDVDVGIVLESDGAQAQSLAAAFAATPYLRVKPARHRREVEHMLVAGDLKAFAVIPADFEARLLGGQGDAAIQIIADASNPNTANFTVGYLRGVYQSWLSDHPDVQATSAAISLEQRFWFNPELQSRRILLPGSMAIIITMIGTLLTALVMSREWERGTMEALMATPASVGEIILSKLLPYFVLGTLAAIGCAFLSIQVLGLPLEGSFGALLLLSMVFLVPALGQGLLISSLVKNQFLAAQMAVVTGFLPALLLSGFLYDIHSMPWVLQQITRVVPARYFVSSLQTVFLAGDVWSVYVRDIAAMLGVGAFFFGIIRIKLKKRLD
jgi:ABC-2 type transport system permease protein